MKKLFKKAVTMGLAAIMAVSAMSISAFAEGEDTSNDVVISVLNENGIMQDYTQTEIDALGGVIEGYGGINVEILPEDFVAPFAPMMTRATYSYSRISPPSGTPYDIYNSQYYATFSFDGNGTKFSDRLLTSEGSTVYMQLYGAKDSNGYYLTNFNNNLSMTLFVNGVPYITMNVTTNAYIRLTDLVKNSEYYASIINNTGAAASGEATIGSH